MKRLVTLALCSSMALSVFATGFTLKDNTNRPVKGDHEVIVEIPDKKPVSFEDKLAKKALELINRLDKMAGSKEAIDFYSGSEEISKNAIKFAAVDYNYPVAVYKAEIPYGKGSVAQPDFDLKKLPEELRKYTDDRFVLSIPMTLAASSGVTSVATSSILTIYDSFISEDIKENTIYFFEYEDGLNGSVVFIKNADNIVSATATLIESKELSKVTNVKEMNALFDNAFEFVKVK